MSSRKYRFRRGQLVPGAIARMALGRMHNARHTLGRRIRAGAAARGGGGTALERPSAFADPVEHEARDPG